MSFTTVEVEGCVAVAAHSLRKSASISTGGLRLAQREIPALLTCGDTASISTPSEEGGFARSLTNLCRASRGVLMQTHITRPCVLRRTPRKRMALLRWFYRDASACVSASVTGQIVTVLACDDDSQLRAVAEIIRPYFQGAGDVAAEPTAAQ